MLPTGKAHGLLTDGERRRECRVKLKLTPRNDRQPMLAHSKAHRDRYEIASGRKIRNKTGFIRLKSQCPCPGIRITVRSGITVSGRLAWRIAKGKPITLPHTINGHPILFQSLTAN